MAWRASNSLILLLMIDFGSFHFIFGSSWQKELTITKYIYKLVGKWKLKIKEGLTDKTAFIGWIRKLNRLSSPACNLVNFNLDRSISISQSRVNHCYNKWLPFLSHFTCPVQIRSTQLFHRLHTRWHVSRFPWLSPFFYHSRSN